jgi:hypothetical protein
VNTVGVQTGSSIGKPTNHRTDIGMLALLKGRGGALLRETDLYVRLCSMGVWSGT